MTGEAATASKGAAAVIHGSATVAAVTHGAAAAPVSFGAALAAADDGAAPAAAPVRGRDVTWQDPAAAADSRRAGGVAAGVNTSPARFLAAGRGAAGPSPDPGALPGELPLRDGTPALIWPLLPTDARLLREMFRRLSPKSRQRRFLSVLSELDDAMIRLLVGGVDGVHHVALLLIVLPPDGEERPVGVGRLIQDPADPATADIAFTVADDWQGRGVGTTLAQALMERRPAAVRRLRTEVDAENRASLALLARAGRMSSSVAYRGVVDVTVELTAA